jgi:hypothetical protein
LPNAPNALPRVFTKPDAVVRSTNDSEWIVKLSLKRWATIAAESCCAGSSDRLDRPVVELGVRKERKSEQKRDGGREVEWMDCVLHLGLLLGLDLPKRTKEVEKMVLV